MGPHYSAKWANSYKVKTLRDVEQVWLVPSAPATVRSGGGTSNALRAGDIASLKLKASSGCIYIHIDNSRMRDCRTAHSRVDITMQCDSIISWGWGVGSSDLRVCTMAGGTAPTTAPTTEVLQVVFVLASPPTVTACCSGGRGKRVLKPSEGACPLAAGAGGVIVTFLLGKAATAAMKQLSAFAAATAAGTGW